MTEELKGARNLWGAHYEQWFVPKAMCALKNQKWDCKACLEFYLSDQMWQSGILFLSKAVMFTQCYAKLAQGGSEQSVSLKHYQCISSS